MMRWISFLLLALTATAASGATLHSRDGKTCTGEIALADGKFTITTSDGQTASFAPAEISAIDFRQAAPPTTSTAPAPDDFSKVGTGLRGEYFSDLTFHHRELVRSDPSIAFNFTPPNEPIHAVNPQEWRNMSVRWTGTIRPRFSEQYHFYVNSDSLTRLWIDHRLILENGRSEGICNLKAGTDYDLRVDWVGHTRYEAAIVEWGSASQPREPLPTDCLFPPQTSQAVVPPSPIITTPADGSVLAGPVDVPMSVFIRPGSSTPVKVEYADGEVPIGSTKTPPFDFVWSNAPTGDHRLIATVTNADGSTGSSQARHVIIASDAGQTLPKPWVTCAVPAPGLSPAQPAPPGQPPQPAAAPSAEPPPPLTFKDNTLVIKHTGGDVYSQSDGFRYVFQRLVGDGSVIARVADISADQKAARPLAGVMIRDALTGPSTYVAMLSAPTVGDVFMYRPAPAAPVVNTSSTGQSPVYFKLSRKGYNVRAYRSTDGQKWEFMGECAFLMRPSILVGVMVCGGDPAVTATATFDHLAVTTATDADTPKFQPAVVLTDGTRIVGAVTKVANGNATITPASPLIPPPAPLALDNIARVLYRPLSPDALAALTPSQTGAFLNTGDFYEGEIDNFTADHLTVNSVVFGPRDLAPQDLSALILHPISKPAPYEVTLSDGSIIESPTLSTTATGIQLQSNAGAITVALKDVQQIATH